MEFKDGKFYTYGQALEHVNCIIQPNEQTPHKGGLWLGDLIAASSNNIIEKNEIKAVLTVASGTNLKYSPQLVPNHLIIEADDFPSYDMYTRFQEIIQFIDNNLQTTNVLVHCYQGMSRSSTAVLAYIMYKKEMTFDQAFRVVQKARPGIFPNIGFVNQLKKFQNKLDEDYQNKVNPKQRNRDKINQIYEESNKNF